MDWKKIGLYAAAFALGGATYAVTTSGLGRKACVGLARKGIKLRECVAYSLESAKEGLEDIVAEAKAEEERGTCCNTAENTCEI
jgi:hypothetical protein